jgi:hypothetical protein
LKKKFTTRSKKLKKEEKREGNKRGFPLRY